MTKISNIIFFIFDSFFGFLNKYNILLSFFISFFSTISFFESALFIKYSGIQKNIFELLLIININGKFCITTSLILRKVDIPFNIIFIIM